jgi:hypothetical protein
VGYETGAVGAGYTGAGDAKEVEKAAGAVVPGALPPDTQTA